MLWVFSPGAEERANQIIRFTIDSHNFGEGPELILHERCATLAFPLLSPNMVK